MPRQTVSATIKRESIEFAKRGLAPPLYFEVPYQSPASAYPKFAGPMSFLLESIKGPPRIARYSFIGFDPYVSLRVKDGVSEIITGSGTKIIGMNPLRILRELTTGYGQMPCPSLPPFQGGAVGLLSYDFLHYIEKVPKTTRDDLMVPDAHFLLVDKVIAFDHMEKKAWAVVCPGARAGRDTDWRLLYDEAEQELGETADTLKTGGSRLRATTPTRKIDILHDMSEMDYVAMVRRTKEYISAGDIFQANLSLRVSADLKGTDPWEVYSTLRHVNPSPFAAFIDFGDYFIASSSPERLVRVKDGIVETRPIAGTRPRGKDENEDMRMREDLLLNEKERAEHIMLIDLERNDIGRVCDYGTVSADEFMITEDYSHVIHIVSNIRGALAKGKTHTDVIRAAFPGGTITGVPKVRCMEIIDELEPLRRGPYTGSVGYIGFSGDMDLNIVIRTFTITRGTAYVQAGAGIVADSDPLREYQESLKKAEALVRTLELVGRRADTM